MTLIPRHVEFISGANTYKFRVDENAEVPFRRISNSLMVPRADISGAPGAVNLQRDVWLWTMTDFRGGEGRLVFDSADPLGPPAFRQTDGGVDVRVAGEFSLHPDENFVPNLTSGGSTPTVTTWTNTDFTDVTGTPEYSQGPSADRVRLGASDKVQSAARTPGTNVIRVAAKFKNAKTVKGNRKVSVKLLVRNTTDSTDTTSATGTMGENEPLTLLVNFTGTAGKTYRYYMSNEDTGDVTVMLAAVAEESYATGPVAPQNIRDIRVGIGDDVYALSYDGTNTDVVKWNFSTDAWDLLHSNVVAADSRGLTGSDQNMYWMDTNGDIWKTDGTTSAQYANDPTAAGFSAAASVGSPLGLTVANNKLYALYSQALFELTLDLTSGLPLSESADYAIVASPAEFYKEASPDTDKKQHICAISNGVRFFTNVRGEQTTIWEYSDGALKPTHFLPTGYIATSIRHYANITFIAATFTNEASAPAEKKAGIYYVSSDNLLRFLGYLRFQEADPAVTFPYDVSYISSYGHDVYFLQSKRIWRYNLGSGGITLENVTGQAETATALSMARMDKKFWVAVKDVGTFIADDSYPKTTMWLYSPIWDYDVPDLDKVLLSFDVNTRPLPANTQVDIEYSLDEGAWTSAGSITTDDAVDSRITISSGTSTTKFRTLSYRVGLTSTDGTDTPRVLSVTARAYILEYEDSFDMTLLCDDDDASEHLASEQRSGRKKATDLWTLKTDKSLVQMKVYWAGNPRNPTDVDSYTTVAIEDPFQEISEHGQSAIRLRVKSLG